MSSASKNSDFDLFPVPTSTPPSSLSPRTWPGISPSSTAALQRVLIENHEKWHIFFNDRGFHNHVSHHALANWSLGASGALIEAGYQDVVGSQRPAFKSPEEITLKNFNDHLGDERYYNAYLSFFTEIVKEKGMAASVEEYIFSAKANFDSARGVGEKQPEMLNRILSSICHPLIHVGYGLEFGLPGMIIEGLAETCVHHLAGAELLPPSFFESTNSTSVVGKIMSGFSTLSLSSPRSVASASPSGANVHAFTVLARMLKDDRFDPKPRDEMTMFSGMLQDHGEALKKYADQWTVDISNPNEIEKKIEELAWMNVVLYGIGGWNRGDFRANFFLMHLVTSSMFIPSITAYLSPRSQVLLLRSYFTVCLGWWVAGGRPILDVKDFCASSTANPTPSGPLPTPYKTVLLSPSHPDAVTPNTWLPLIETTIVYADDHLSKLQRTLAQYGTKYGTRIAGLPDFTGTELEGAEHLDGTLFIRIAGLTAKRLGRVREGEPSAEFWDRGGFYQ